LPVPRGARIRPETARVRPSFPLSSLLSLTNVPPLAPAESLPRRGVTRVSRRAVRIDDWSSNRVERTERIGTELREVELLGLDPFGIHGPDCAGKWCCRRRRRSSTCAGRTSRRPGRTPRERARSCWMPLDEPSCARRIGPIAGNWWLYSSKAPSKPCSPFHRDD